VTHIANISIENRSIRKIKTANTIQKSNSYTTEVIKHGFRPCLIRKKIIFQLL